jgi:hypothetical protein
MTTAKVYYDQERGDYFRVIGPDDEEPSSLNIETADNSAGPFVDGAWISKEVFEQRLSDVSIWPTQPERHAK